MDALGHMIAVLGVILAVWTVVSGVVVVMTVRVWRHYDERTDRVSTVSTAGQALDAA